MVENTEKNIHISQILVLRLEKVTSGGKTHPSLMKIIQYYI